MDLPHLLDRLDSEIEVSKNNWKAFKTIEARNLWLDARWAKVELEKFAPGVEEARAAIRLRKLEEQRREQEKAKRHQEEQRRRHHQNRDQNEKGTGSNNQSHRNEKPLGGETITKLQALQILGLKGEATPAEIQATYSRLMKRVHPDLGGSDYFAKQLNQARDILLN